jgi:hypothetical protein
VYKFQLFLFAAPAFMALVDAALTLNGQSADYWNGNYQAVDELSPDFHRLLAAAPAAFCGGVVAWLSILAALLFLLPRFFALALAAAATIGHSAGAASWFLRSESHGYQLGILLCLFAGILLAASVTLTYRKADGQEASHPLNPWLRWSLVVLLLAVPIYVYVVPH